MRILIAAARISPPWTEGRKALVVDLARTLSRDQQLYLISTGPQEECFTDPCEGKRIRSRFRAAMLPFFHRQVRGELSRRPYDAVLHFPFSTFHGIYRMINLWSIWAVDRICAGSGVACYTIPYGITRDACRPICRVASNAVFAKGGQWTGPAISMGRDLDRFLRLQTVTQKKPTLLFMAGLYNANHADVSNVREVRGLDLLIQSASDLRDAGYRLIVAIPFLKDSAVRNQIQNLLLQDAKGLDLDLRAEISVPEIFQEADLFLFPFAEDLAQFTPTSVLEAMASGLPVVISDLPSFQSLTAEGRNAFLFPAGNRDAMLDSIKSCLQNRSLRESKREAARCHVREQFSIERTASEILDIIKTSDL